jgi:RNA recognition motif-containing protein
MGNKLYVGNLPYSYRDSDMEQAFSQFGNVSSAKVMMERDTGRSKGFGFVEMGSDAEAQAAISRHERPASRWSWPRGQRSPSDGSPSPPQRRLRRRWWWWRLRWWRSRPLLMAVAAASPVG